MVKETILDIPENYSSFGEFYFKNKSLIFNTLLNGYRKLSNNSVSTVIVKINACVETLNFETNFYISKNDDEIIERLLNTYLPYYEEVEEYETCDEIKQIYKKIKGV